jgi:putative transposase
MQYLGHKTRIHLNNKQASTFVHWSNARRFAYNWALNICTIECSQNENRLTLSNIDIYDKWFNAAKYPLGTERKTKGAPLKGTGVHEWIKGIPGSVCQTAIKTDLKQAFVNFFKGVARPPKFQVRHRAQPSFSLSNKDFKFANIQLSQCKIKLPKNLGSARLGDLPNWINEIEKLSFTSFSRHADKWYVSFIFGVPDSVYFKNTAEKQPVAGVDLGITKYAALSTGEDIVFPKEKVSKIDNDIAMLQKKLNAHLIRSAKVITSSCSNESCRGRPFRGMNEVRYYCKDCRAKIKNDGKEAKKLKKNISRKQSQLAHVRENAAEHLSVKLAREFDVVCMEDMSIKQMTQSAGGTIDKPGTNVKQKTKLNRAFLNVTPYRVKLKTQYKTERYGGTFVLVDPKYTSQECHKCGHVSADNRQSQVHFKCVSCGFEMNADTNAAINIANKGLALLKNELLTQSGKVDARQR